jgi:diguanylate cyclase (GGDEF)-like protein/PAS domain S-box-containing protein
MGARGSSNDTASLRVPRGVRSLSGRLVLLLSIPLLAAQAMAAIALVERHRTAADARELTREIDLVADVGLLFAPIALEKAASVGLATLDQIGADRDIVTEVTGIDYETYIADARVDLDEGLEHLVEEFADLMLPSGQLLADEVAVVTERLTVMRELIDAGAADPAEVTATTVLLDRLMKDLLGVTGNIHSAGGDAAHLGELADHVSHLLSLARALSGQALTTSDALGATPGPNAADDVLVASGAAELAIDQYTEQLAADGQSRWAPVKAKLDEHRAHRSRLAEIARIRAAPADGDQPSLFVSDPDLIRELASLIRTEFDNLRLVGMYTRDELRLFIDRADIVAQQSDDEVRLWTFVIVVVTISSVGFLVLVAVSTARPLAKLTARALRLGQGVVDPRPLPLSGPSDVRAVTETFNNVTQVLSTFDEQIRRLSAGERVLSADVDRVPGMLGESLRAQIEHLSNMTSRLRESEAFARAVIATAADAIWTIDARGRIMSANDSAEALLGADERSQRGRSFLRIAGIRRLDGLAGEATLLRRDGATVDVLLSHSEVPTSKGSIHTVFARDISDRKRFEQELAHQARHDGLTGLPNRLAALEHLEQVARRVERLGTSVAVLFVDLDGFKSVNDSRGHAAGDHLLHEVAVRLANSLRSSEFVARLGGDEFLVVCESLTADAATALGERLIREIAQPYSNGDDLYTISASVGVAIADGAESIDALELIREADVAVYHAKDRGRARVVVFDASLQEAVEATAEIELALRQAITNEELVLHYQPVLDLASGTPWGAEALVRWNRPGHGLLGPDRFIPVAERTSLVIDLGRWVLLQSCRTLAGWQADPVHRHLRMAVNVSGRHLVEGNLVADVDEVLARTGADPHGLEVELTETHLLADFERANQVLTQLRQRGVKVAVDDFGTGYSSMGYLRQLEIDTLKIDRMFVARVNDVGYDRTIVEVLVQLGLTLGLDIVAEGIETIEQLDFMRSRQCTRGQGYHIARPMPIDALDNWLTTVPSAAVPTTG